MTVIEAIRSRLLGVSPVTAIASTRIYPLAFPQSAIWPAVRLQLIGRVEFMHLRGSARVYRARIQVDSVVDVEASADPYAAVHALAAAVHGDGQGASATGLCGFTGDIGSPAFQIRGILPAGGPLEFYETTEERLLRVQHDYLTWFVT